MGIADTKPGDPGCGGSGQLVEANDLQGVCLCSHGEAALFSQFQSTPTLICEVFFINVRLAEYDESGVIAGDRFALIYGSRGTNG